MELLNLDSLYRVSHKFVAISDTEILAQVLQKYTDKKWQIFLLAKEKGVPYLRCVFIAYSDSSLLYMFKTAYYLSVHFSF